MLMAILPPKLAVLLAGADSITQYAWDSRNRLVRIQGSEVDAAFKYDALGRRIERTINGDTTQYLYDGDQAIAELRNGAVSAHILTGLQIDEVIARYTTQGERTLLTDALGSVLISTKEDGTVATAYGYSSYGEVQLLGSDEQNSIQYTARENDGTGLYYYRARYYDPQLKRFVSEDPIGINGGLNVYAYVGGRPLNYIDPMGLDMASIPRAITGFINTHQRLPSNLPPSDTDEKRECPVSDCKTLYYSEGTPPSCTYGPGEPSKTWIGNCYPYFVSQPAKCPAPTITGVRG